MRAAGTALLVMIALACGCKRAHQADLPHYPGGAAGLQALFTDILGAARRDERERVHDLLATTRMTDAELLSLFGDTARPLLPRYHALMDTLVYRGALELVAEVLEQKYDAVEVLPIDPNGAHASAADRAIGYALRHPLPFYAVRVKRAADKTGLRYDFFTYLGGRWVTGNLIGKFLPPAPSPPPVLPKKRNVRTGRAAP